MVLHQLLSFIESAIQVFILIHWKYEYWLGNGCEMCTMDPEMNKINGLT